MNPKHFYGKRTRENIDDSDLSHDDISSLVEIEDEFDG